MHTLTLTTTRRYSNTSAMREAQTEYAQRVVPFEDAAPGDLTAVHVLAEDYTLLDAALYAFGRCIKVTYGFEVAVEN